jgi:hypothetical protein
MAYDRLDLIPDPWRQTGTLAATIANLWTDRGRYGPDDFIPRPRPVRILSGKAGRAWFQGLAAAAAAKFARAKDKGDVPSPPSDGSRSA